jgi:hypothetical protein
MAVLPSARVPGGFAVDRRVRGRALRAHQIVLAIACSNVASMLSRHLAPRDRDPPGGGRWRTPGRAAARETSALFLLAAVASLALSWWMVAFLESFTPTLPIPITVDLIVDARVLAFALGLALLTALTFGLAPALRATRLDIVTALHGQHSTPDRRRMRLRHVLVGAQVALALVLLVTTGLFLRALQSAASADTGYDGRCGSSA